MDGILLLKSTAKFRGNIIAQKLAIENGADFNGNCHMGAGQPKFEQIAVPAVENELVY